MTSGTGGIELRVLGPLEVLVDDQLVSAGGSKQRTVLALLALHVGEIVSVERFLDEVWEDNPPPSARHSLEAYISRLRQLLKPHGAKLVRRGGGYSLVATGVSLDSTRFLEVAEAAAAAAGREALGHAAELASTALALWRGPALAGTPLGRAGRAECERLEESRLTVAELHSDIQLRRGLYSEVVASLQPLVAEHPFRERLVAQLMIALYGSGRHAEALEAYERTRSRLRDDLGLQPSSELQELSAEIVRQELRLPSTPPPAPEEAPPAALASRRPLARLLLLAAGAAVVAVAIGGSVPRAPAVEGALALPAKQAPVSFALVLPQDNPDLENNRTLSQSFARMTSAREFRGNVFTVAPGDARAVARIVGRIEAGDFTYVIAVGAEVSRALAPAAKTTDAARFAFVDMSLADLSLRGAENVTAVRFAEEHTANLMGFLAAIVRPRSSRDHRVDKVSAVLGPASHQSRLVVEGFETGVRGARGEVDVRIDHVGDTTDPTACEAAANAQIDEGSDVLYVDAGRCGLGASAVARTRGIWVIGGLEDGVLSGPHVLARTYKDWEHAIRMVVSNAWHGEFHPGVELSLGLDDDYAVGVDVPDFSPASAEHLWSRVVERCSRIRQQAAAAEL